MQVVVILALLVFLTSFDLDFVCLWRACWAVYFSDSSLSVLIQTLSSCVSYVMSI